jgi:hypothetical protein
VQTIFQTSLTPEQYAEQESHRQVPPPANCLNCHRAHCLEALGYYERWISTVMSLFVPIFVRRFICRHCRVTVSCLPQFAQPYRLVNTPTVAAGFNGDDTRTEVRRWKSLIGVYWRQFEKHLPALLLRLGNAFGAAPVRASARGFWGRLIECCGDLETATRRMVHQFHTCLFGTYRCHQRPQARAA